MSFDPSQLLRRATSRAKSDVANKLVSMLLHELSRSINQSNALTVNSSNYAKIVGQHFGAKCPYCSRDLEPRHVAVEHLDGMNRFRAGLHVSGNVVVSCADCNREKRRDDQAKVLNLAATGWESFLTHDSTSCVNTCKTCLYWKRLIPNADERSRRLLLATERIREFRAIPEIKCTLEKSQLLQQRALSFLENFYREGQLFASNRISELAGSIIGKPSPQNPCQNE
jgi:hypothetical protein